MGLLHLGVTTHVIPVPLLMLLQQLLMLDYRTSSGLSLKDLSSFPTRFVGTFLTLTRPENLRVC